MKTRLCLYYKNVPETDRWIIGDRFVRPLIRRLIRGEKIGGIRKVFINLCKGLDRLDIQYEKNLPFERLNPEDAVIVLGAGKYVLEGYNKPNKIIAGIGLMTHPSEWPDLCEKYPIKKYLQHSEWTVDVYRPYFGDDICALWPAGIDTEQWSPDQAEAKTYDALIYSKIHWDEEKVDKELVLPIKKELISRNLTFQTISYGHYKEHEFKDKLKSSRFMIFLTEHESQGFACCEAMSMNVPIFAWDEGHLKDPNRFRWRAPFIRATSVPFFNEKCGMRFQNYSQFESQLNLFLFKLATNKFAPRQYVLDNLTLERSAQNILKLVKEVYG